MFLCRHMRIFRSKFQQKLHRSPAKQFAYHSESFQFLYRKIYLLVDQWIRSTQNLQLFAQFSQNFWIISSGSEKKSQSEFSTFFNAVLTVLRQVFYQKMHHEILYKSKRADLISNVIMGYRTKNIVKLQHIEPSKLFLSWKFQIIAYSSANKKLFR